MTVRVGFLGAGLIAGYHARSLVAAEADFAFAGVHDADADRAATFAGWTGATVCDDPETVVAESDAVYVCAWTSEHPHLVTLAAAQRTAVFCEKPLAVDLPTAEAMVETVAAAGIVNQVGLVLRSSNAFAMLEHLAADPSSGRVLSVTFHDDQCLPVGGWYDSAWRGDPSRAGSGVLLEHSIHDIDLIERLGGHVVSVSANSDESHGITGIEDLVGATFRYAGGGIANLTTVWHDIPERLNDRRVEVVCERLWAVLEGDWIGPLRWQRPGQAPEELHGDALLERVAVLGLGREIPDGAFVRAVAAGHRAQPAFADALRAHRVVDAAYRSARSGGTPIAIPAPA
ncbi:MAG: Gfo/Idh/MocA family oxidoreductase [Acidimicrobiales bacterium]